MKLSVGVPTWIRGTGTLLPALLLLHGCQPPTPRQSQTILPDFFACREWADENGDGRIQDEEWKGIGSVYRTQDQITFVAYLHEEVGVQISWRLFGPDGMEHHFGISTQQYRVHVQRQSYRGQWMVNRGGSGPWKMEWSVNGEVVNVTTVILTT